MEFQARAGDHWWAGRYQTGPVLATVSSVFPETPASISEALSPVPPHHIPVHPQQKRRKLNFLRIYWTKTCHAFQPGPSRPCTRKEQRIRPQGPHRCTPMFLRVPCCSTIRVTWLSLWESQVPSLLSDLAMFLALSGLQVLYPPWEDVIVLSRDRAGPTQSPGRPSITDSVEADGVQVLSVSHGGCCAEVLVFRVPTSLNPLRCQGFGPQRARHPHPLAGGGSGNRAGNGPIHRPGWRGRSGGAGLLH